MKVLIFFIIVICLPILLYSNILEVDVNGSCQYTVIQEAINASSNGDTVLVHPSRYYENINLNGHSITLASLYVIEPMQSYIDSTIIDGNYLGSCIMIENGENAEVNGFTLINNENGINIPLEDYPDNAGGGIYLDWECYVILANCIIRNCFSKWGGGLAINRGAYCEINNVRIFNNRALIMGGGLFLGEGIITFNQKNSSTLCVGVNRKV